MDLERRQRNDIDDVSGNRLTLDMDALTLVNSPYVVTPERYEANNWVIISDKYTKYSIAEDDILAFVFNPITDLSQKNITDVTVSFDFIATNILLDNISLSHYDLVEQKICKIPLNGNGHIDVSCNIFGLNNEVLNSIISEQGFNIGLNFKGLKSNTTVRIWNVEVSFKFTNKLYDESDAVVNRLEPYIDFYRDDDDLILQIGDGSGKGHKEDQGGDIDAYTKAEVDAKLELKVNTEVGKGLSSNDYTLAEKNKLSGIETGANNYTHPANHYTNMIREESALQNLEVSANSTQHDINLAIDSKITQGGGSGGSYINDYYWDDESQDIILDYDSGVSEADIVTSWSSPLRDDRVPSEKLVKEYVDNSGGGSSVDIVTTWEQILSDSKVASEKLVKNTIDNLSIPSKTSDLVNDSGFTTFDGDYDSLTNKPTIPTIPTNVSAFNNDVGYLTQHQSLTNYVQKSSTNGLLRNDGSVDTTSYSTFNGDYNSLSNKPTIPTVPSNISAFTNDVGYLTQHQSLANYVQKSSTTGLLRNDGTVDTTSYATSSQISSMLTTSDVVDNLTSTSSTAPLSAKQGKALNDLIGQAITYINQ